MQLHQSGDWSLLSLLYPLCLPAGIARPRYMNEKTNVEGMDGEYLYGLKILNLLVMLSHSIAMPLQIMPS